MIAAAAAAALPGPCAISQGNTARAGCGQIEAGREMLSLALCSVKRSALSLSGRPPFA